MNFYRIMLPEMLLLLLLTTNLTIFTYILLTYTQIHTVDCMNPLNVFSPVCV